MSATALRTCTVTPAQHDAESILTIVVMALIFNYLYKLNNMNSSDSLILDAHGLNAMTLLDSPPLARITSSQSIFNFTIESAVGTKISGRAQ